MIDGIRRESNDALVVVNARFLEVAERLAV
jgi:hypothetical protein